MKCILFSSCFIIFGYHVFAQGLENIIVEKYYVSNKTDANSIGGYLPIGSVTYRIYVDMLPGYKFQAAFGIPGHELRLATTTLFYNNEDKGGTIPNVIPDACLKDNTVMLDSWLSAGGASESKLGILKSDDDGINTIVSAKNYLQNEDTEAGIPIKVQDGFVAGIPPRVTSFGIDSAIAVFNNQTIGSVFSTSNGSWATLGGSIGPTADNMVLIAQLTTNGYFSFELNIQIGTSGGGVEQYVAKNPVGNEIQVAGLIYPMTNGDGSTKLNKEVPDK